jgi:hypothetical protein
MNGIKGVLSAQLCLCGYLGRVGARIFGPPSHVYSYVLLTLPPLIKIRKIKNRHKAKADSKYGRKITIHDTSLLQGLS